MAVWQWVVTVAGGISAVIGAITGVKKLFKPLTDLSDRVSTVEKHTEADYNRLYKLENMAAHQERVDTLVCEALLAIVDHMIDGNHIDKMKATRTDLRERILELK